MKIFKNKLTLQKEISKDNCISFVPTMGGLHKGHLSLIRRARNYNCKICVSIFVNPKQFNKKNDYQNYPRNIKNDIKVLKDLKINYLYLPKYKDIYSFNTINKVYLDKFSKQLCGKFRKGHFQGVLDVINRFLEIIRPKYMYLGIKDFQQLTLIDRHISKNEIKTKVIKCKTIREKNGVACSTRNLNLTSEQLLIASNVYKYFLSLKNKIKKNKKLFDINIVKDKMMSLGVTKVDYLKNINLKNIQKLKKKNNKFKLFVAYYIDNIRLIDNI